MVPPLSTNIIRAIPLLPPACPSQERTWVNPQEIIWGSVMPLLAPWLGPRARRAPPSLPVWQHDMSPSLLLGFGTDWTVENVQEEALWGCTRGQGAFSSQEDLLWGALALYNQQVRISTSLNLGDCVQNAWGCSPGFAELKCGACYAWSCERGPGASCQDHETTEAELSPWPQPPAHHLSSGEHFCLCGFVCLTVLITHLECPSHSQLPSLCWWGFTGSKAGGESRLHGTMTFHQARLEVHQGEEALFQPHRLPWPWRRSIRDREPHRWGRSCPGAQSVLSDSAWGSYSCLKSLVTSRKCLWILA